MSKAESVDRSGASLGDTTWRLDSMSDFEVVTADGKHCVASCGPSRDYAFDANTCRRFTRLITAAPELLAACESVYALQGQIYANVDLVNEAIEKALGR